MTYSTSARPVRVLRLLPEDKPLHLNRNCIVPFRQRLLGGETFSRLNIHPYTTLASNTLLLAAWAAKSEQTKTLLQKNSDKLRGRIAEIAQKQAAEKKKADDLDKRIANCKRKAQAAAECCEAKQAAADKLREEIVFDLNLLRKMAAQYDEMNADLSGVDVIFEQIDEAGLPSGLIRERSDRRVSAVAKEIDAAAEKVENFIMTSVNPIYEFSARIVDMDRLQEGEKDGRFDENMLIDEIDRFLTTTPRAELRRRINEAKDEALALAGQVPSIHIPAVTSMEKRLRTVKKAMKHATGLSLGGFRQAGLDQMLECAFNETMETSKRIRTIEGRLEFLQKNLQGQVQDMVQSLEAALDGEDALIQRSSLKKTQGLDEEIGKLRKRIENNQRRIDFVLKLQERVLGELEDRQYAWREKHNTARRRAKRKELNDAKRLTTDTKVRHVQKETPSPLDEELAAQTRAEGNMELFLLRAEEVFFEHLPRHYSLRGDFLRQVRRLGRVYQKYGQLGIGEMEKEFSGKNFRDEENSASSSASGIYRIGFSSRSKFRFLLDVNTPKRPTILFIGDADACHRIVQRYLYKGTGVNGAVESLDLFASLK